MQIESIFDITQYTLSKEQKDIWLFRKLLELTKYHRENSASYRKILEVLHPASFQTLSELPYLPVGLFKKQEMLSIPKEQVFKTLYSSGTTSSKPSKVFLDKQTAKLQSAALVNIMTSFLGKQRLPMLIIDTPTVIRDRKSLSARGAGILGMMNFGRDHLFVLNDNMELNRQALKDWVEKHQHSSVLLFGFTFMVWKYFIQQLSIDEIKLPKGILVHSGGWKKLADEAVDNQRFKEVLKQVAAIKRCHGFYGMVEQVGSVFVECEESYLHCPNFAEVIVRDPRIWDEAKRGEEGVIQVLSTLPKGYPGHSLLTEDLGTVIGIDNCRCGRKGKYFQIHGRVPKTELRGCSNTFSRLKKDEG